MFAAQASAHTFSSSPIAASPASSVGKSFDSASSLRASSRHFTGVDNPTPRGSKPTMSYASRTVVPK